MGDMMKAGELYIWPGCFRIDAKTGQVTDWLMPFFYCDNGGLIPKPTVGVNVSKMPQGEGIPTKYIHRMYEASKTN